MANARQKTATEQLEELYPGKLSLLRLSERPTLWFESDEQYDAILLGLLIEHNPIHQSELILVKDLADCQFEINRLRRMKRASAAVELPNAVSALAGPFFESNAPAMGVSPDDASLSQIVRQASKGDKDAREKLETVMEDADVTYEMLLYKAASLGLHTMTALEMALHRKERERHTLNRMLEERQKANIAMGKAFFDALPWGDAKRDSERDGLADDETKDQE